MPIQIQFRRGTASEWTAANTVLALGEPGYETDTGKFKVGNGSTAWNSLAYSSGPKGDTGSTGTTGATGPAGTAATVSVGTTTTGSAGSSASVTNSGTSSAAVLNFTVPQGAAGTAATVSVGTTTTGAAGSSATVTNSGTSSAAVLNFTIPQGATGATGPAGSTLKSTLTSSTGIANTETNVVSLTIPANYLVVGSTYRIVGYGVRTGANTTAPTFNMRIGTTTSATAGTIAVAPAMAGTATASNFFIEAYVTVRTTGASGTILGSGQVLYGATPALTNNTTAVAVDTTAINYLKFNATSGNGTNTYTFHVASIEQVA